jgi:hypothetical protein
VFRRKQQEPLRGAPEVRRLKSYQSETGCVYQYCYDGWRPVKGGREFIFLATAGRAEWEAVSVVISAKAVRAWELAKAREMLGAEWHAVAKMALFAAFDERSPEQLTRDVVSVGAADVEAILERLGRG